MRIYANPTQYHVEDDVDPETEEHYFSKYGENWKEKLAEEKLFYAIEAQEEYEFYNFNEEI